MPFDSSGNYSLPSGYEAENGQTIQPSQHNTPLEDIRSALSSALLRSGVASMTGAFKAADGTAALPGISFNTQTGTGLYKTAGGLSIAVNGAQVVEITSAGIISGATPIGAGMDYWGTTAPDRWLFPYGQAVSRTTYAALFAVIGTTYGVGDGSTTFNLPDKRDRASFGKGDMGGAAASRITNQSGGWEGDTLGAVGGAQTHTLTAAQQASMTVSASGTVTPTVGGGTQALAVNGSGVASKVDSPAGSSDFYPSSVFQVLDTKTVSVTGTATGSGGAHNNLPPGIVCNYIIFAGA